MDYSKIIIYVVIIINMGYLASFFHCLFYRKNNGISQIKYPRSFCDSCKKILTVVDLLPSLGYILNRGKCSKCKSEVDNKSFKSETVIMIISTLILLLIDSNIIKYSLLALSFIFMVIFVYKSEMKTINKN